MQRRFLTTLFVLLVLATLFAGTVVSAQTGQPGAACASATPCADQVGVTSAFAETQISTAAAAAVSVAESQPVASGFGLAWAVMILLVAALLYALVAALLVAFGWAGCLVDGCASPASRETSSFLRAAMRAESTRDICPAPMPTVAPSLA